MYQLIGLREKLQENPIFHGKIYGFRLRCSHESRQPIEVMETTRFHHRSQQFFKRETGGPDGDALRLILATRDRRSWGIS